MKSNIATVVGACLLACLVLLPSFSTAQGSGPRRAIEKLEGCGAGERGCVRILKQKSGDNGRKEVKAQLRGGRIIWYEYNPKTGKARRLN